MPPYEDSSRAHYTHTHTHIHEQADDRASSTIYGKLRVTSKRVFSKSYIANIVRVNFGGGGEGKYRPGRDVIRKIREVDRSLTIDANNISDTTSSQPREIVS